MLSDDFRLFTAKNHNAVLATFRGTGAVQMSIVTVGPFEDGAAFTSTAGRAKLGNLKRNLRCSLMVSRDDWGGGYAVLEGGARVMSSDNTAPDELRLALRGVYRAASGKEHPDREEYDEAMRAQQRSVIKVVSNHTYGTAV